MDSSGSDLELEAFRAATLERRRRAAETPWEQTPLGTALIAAEAAARAAESSMSEAELEHARIRAERMSRRAMRAEARRMTVAKYHAQLQRTAAAQTASTRIAAERETLGAVVKESRPRSAPRRRQHRPVRRARARSPSESDEPEPPGAAPRTCRCGCGEPVSGRPNKLFVNATHRVRGHRLVRVDPVERYRDEVWSLRRAGEIDAEEALELLVRPSAHVLARLQAVAA